jgi:hypothetical protein
MESIVSLRLIASSKELALAIVAAQWSLEVRKTGCGLPSESISDVTSRAVV